MKPIDNKVSKSWTLNKNNKMYDPSLVNYLLNEALLNGDRTIDIEKEVQEEKDFQLHTQELGEDWFYKEVLSPPMTHLDISIGTNGYYGFDLTKQKGKKDIPLDIKIGNEDTQYDLRKSYEKVYALVHRFHDEMKAILDEDDSKDIEDIKYAY